MVRKKSGGAGHGPFGHTPFGHGGLNAYDRIAIVFSKTHMTLVKMIIDSIPGKLQEAENYLFSEKEKPPFIIQSDSQTNILIEDNFNRANSNDPGADWDETDDDTIWSIASNKLVGTPSGSDFVDQQIRRQTSDDFSNGTISVDFDYNITTTADPSILCRMTEKNNFQSGYSVSVGSTGGVFGINKITDGSLTLLSLQFISSLVVGTNYRVIFSCDNDVLTATLVNVDTSTIISTQSTTDSTYLSKGSSGLAVNTAGNSINFEDFKVIKNVFNKPYLISKVHQAQEIKETVTLVDRVTLKFADDFNRDGSSFWGDWRVKNRSYKNRRIDILKGFKELTEDQFLTHFKGIIENIITRPNKTIEIIVKGLLKLTNKEFPKATDGKLSAELNFGAITEITMQQGTGLDPLISSGHQYNSAGYFKMGTESFIYTGIVDISSGAKTQFKFTGVTRAQFLTDGWDDGITDSEIVHAEGATIQQVEVYIDMHPLDVEQDLLLKAGLLSSDINTTSFTSTKNDWLGNALVRGILHKPVKIKIYLKELRQDFFTTLFQNEDSLITANFLAPGVLGATFKTLSDASDIIGESLLIDDNETSRITRVTFEIDEQPDGTFNQQVAYIDSEKEAEYQEQKPVTYQSRWLKTDISGVSAALQTAQNTVRVFGDSRTLITFDLETKDDDLEVGELFIYNGIKYQAIKKEQVDENRWRYKAFDTRLTDRYGFYTSDTIDDYVDATEQERQDNAYYADDNDEMPNGDKGYFYF